MATPATTQALAVPAELAAELATLQHLSFPERIKKVNQAGVRTRYMGRLNIIRMSHEVMWSRLAAQVNRQCDEFIMAANPPDAKGWAGGSPLET